MRKSLGEDLQRSFYRQVAMINLGYTYRLVAKTKRLLGWQPPLENINSLVARGGPRVVARSRELVVTNGYGANAGEAVAFDLVGDRIKPSSLIVFRRRQYTRSGAERLIYLTNQTKVPRRSD